ncbi:hypothetical protein ACFL0N_01545 [Pseudomonadota bacterium]
MKYPENDKPSTGLHLIVMIVMFALILLLGFTTLVEAKGKPGPGSDPARVQILADGAILAVVECDQKMTASTTSVTCNKAGTEFVLDSSIVDAVDPDRDCFNEGLRPGTVQLFSNKDGSATAVFRFHAPDTTGADTLYALEVHDQDGWHPDFPPAESSPIEMIGDYWFLRTANNRQARNACLGNGAGPWNDFIRVTLDRCPSTGCPAN